ncbi:MAG: site-specific DNA-methyltransferase [Chloroflexi bacterium]|nr:site-specific DNA-methyltransferase [Chloroflexota bacterium]
MTHTHRNLTPQSKDADGRPRKAIASQVHLVERLTQFLCDDSLELLKQHIDELAKDITAAQTEEPAPPEAPADEGTISLDRSYILAELAQIQESRTLERAVYYAKRLLRGIVEVKTNGINDINLLRWKEYDEVISDSLWVIPRRDNSGAHIAEYWGNYVPQIPHQMMVRYTKRNDWVLDAFMGSGTTLIEGRRLGRNCIGIELNPQVAARAGELVNAEPNRYNTVADIVTGDNRTAIVQDILHKNGIDRVQLVMLHPPYYDIIKFSSDARDLSNAATLEQFLAMFGETLDNVTPCLEKRRYLCVVIGDKYAGGEWIPLGFYCMNEVLKRPFQLKAIIAKNFEETRGKRNQQELWRYRALAGGFYVYKHEYVMVFRAR